VTAGLESLPAPQDATGQQVSALDYTAVKNKVDAGWKWVHDADKNKAQEGMKAAKEDEKNKQEYEEAQKATCATPKKPPTVLHICAVAAEV
jgi:hypothetical protein